MPQLEVIDSNNLNEWYEYFDELENRGIYHDPTYITLIAEHFDAESELCILKYKDVFVYYPYLKRSLARLPYSKHSDVDLNSYFDIISSWYYGGPLISDCKNELAQELAKKFCKYFSEHCAKTGVISEFIRFDPNIKNYNIFKCLNPIFDRETVYIDLNKTYDDIWNSYEKRNQRAIKKAIKSNIIVDINTNLKSLEVFSEIYLNEMKRKNAPKHYWLTYETLKKLFTKLKNNFELITASLEDTIIGGFIIARGHEVAHHFLSASMPEYWRLRVNNLMFHKAVIASKELGDKIFDFQGGREGVFEFKKGFSPLRGKFYISKLVRNNYLYNRLVEVSKVHGVSNNGKFFPKYRPKE